ncbi:MAG: hypothetical protein CMK92_03505 [Pseudomonas sp.]|nr:hypothetical protein [Pseudomonas sp.]
MARQPQGFAVKTASTRPVSFSEIRENCTHSGHAVSVFRHPGAKTGQQDELEIEHLNDMVQDLLPIAVHAIERQPELSPLPLYLVYVDPHQSLGACVAELTAFLESHQSEPMVWMPVSGNTSLMLNVLRQALSAFASQRHGRMNMLYVGDPALKAALQSLATAAGMSFCFHAFY